LLGAFRLDPRIMVKGTAGRADIHIGQPSNLTKAEAAMVNSQKLHSGSGQRVGQ